MDVALLIADAFALVILSEKTCKTRSTVWMLAKEWESSSTVADRKTASFHQKDFVDLGALQCSNAQKMGDAGVVITSVHSFLTSVRAVCLGG